MKQLLSILCVDDEKIILDSLNSQLTRNFGNNFNYEFAESGEEAIEIIQEILDDHENTIYVIISDWLMPGMKGDELLYKIKNNLKNVKTILLTGHMDNKVVKEIQNSGSGIKCIFKPWDESELISLINN